MWKILAALIAASFAACTLNEPQPAAELGSVDAESDKYALAALDCAEDDCESHPEQTLAQCLIACELGTAAIEAFCRVILSPAIKAACWGVVNKGPQACANFCHWYFTP